MENIATVIFVVSIFFFPVAIGFLIGLFSKRFVFRDKRVPELKRLVKALKEDTYEAIIDVWLNRIGQAEYRNEVEVEVKFITPLLWFLGYESDEFQLRVPVTIYAGRQQLTGIADWVIWDKEAGTAKTIIEAKEAGQQLDEAVQEQARSYAFALKAPMYVLTNGRELEIYQRGVQDDSCIFNCDVDELIYKWEELKNIMGAKV